MTDQKEVRAHLLLTLLKINVVHMYLCTFKKNSATPVLFPAQIMIIKKNMYLFKNMYIMALLNMPINVYE